MFWSIFWGVFTPQTIKLDKLELLSWLLLLNCSADTETALAALWWRDMLQNIDLVYNEYKMFQLQGYSKTVWYDLFNTCETEKKLLEAVISFASWISYKNGFFLQANNWSKMKHIYDNLRTIFSVDALF